MTPGRTPRAWPRWLAAGLLLWGNRLPAPSAAAADPLEPIPPKWLRFRFDRLAAGIDVEAESQEWQSGFSPTPSNRERLYLAPVVEVGGRGSIYHPNLLEYDFHGENFVTYEDFHLSGSPDPADDGSESSVDPLLRYNLNARILKDKPYSPIFHASRSRAFRDLDFFTRTTVDSEGYGGSTGYRTGPIPFNVSYDRRRETESGMARPSSVDEEVLSADATNTRDYGGDTRFTYSHDNFDRRNLGYAQDQGQSDRADLTDTEKLGADDWILLRSSLRFGRVDSTGRDDTDFQAGENLTLRHLPCLQSFYDYSFAERTSGGTDNITHNGGAGLQHQLYESLTSSLEFRGEDQFTDSPSGTLDVLRYGATLNENYTKRLGSWGRLDLGYSVGIQPEERTFSGGDINILDERHTLRDSEVTLLAFPNVVQGSIRVTDPTGTILYLSGLDYVLFPRGTLTEIRRVSGGHIANGGTILVSYVASGQESDQYTNFINSFTWRLELYGRLVSLYARLTIDRKPGGQSASLNEYVDSVLGIESEWRWIQLGAEYENYDSTLTPYEAFRFREGFTFQPRSDATLGINLSQTFTDFPDSRRRVNYQDFIARFEIRPVRSLTIKVEGGYRIEDGDGVDQTIFTARADVTYAVGRLSALLGYEYHDEAYFADTYHKHFLFAKIRRSF